jgi:hypothetical protein
LAIAVLAEGAGYCVEDGAQLRLPVAGLPDGVGIQTQRDVVHEDAPVCLRKVNSPLAAVHEGVEGPHHVIPVHAQVDGEVVAYAVSLRQPVIGLHLSPTEGEAKRFREYWRAWGNHVPLKVVESPYRAIVPPTVAYIESLHAQRPDLTLTVIAGDIAVRHWWQRGLHDDTAVRLRRALEPLDEVVVTSVPFHLQPRGVLRGPQSIGATRSASVSPQKVAHPRRLQTFQESHCCRGFISRGDWI